MSTYIYMSSLSSCYFSIGMLSTPFALKSHKILLKKAFRYSLMNPWQLNDFFTPACWLNDDCLMIAWCCHILYLVQTKNTHGTNKYVTLGFILFLWKNESRIFYPCSLSVFCSTRCKESFFFLPICFVTILGYPVRSEEIQKIS